MLFFEISKALHNMLFATAMGTRLAIQQRNITGVLNFVNIGYFKRFFFFTYLCNL